MVVALAPGSVAVTWMVGKSTCGNGATGNRAYAITPSSATAAASNSVATGRLMNGAERFVSPHARRECRQEVEAERRWSGARFTHQAIAELMALCMQTMLPAVDIWRNLRLHSVMRD